MRNSYRTVVYIAGCFRARNSWEIHQNVLKAEQAMVRLIGEGFAVICPHKMTENLQGLYPDQVYLNMCLELVRRADEVFVLKGWHKSKGTIKEIKLAVELGKVIRYEENEWKS